MNNSFEPRQTNTYNVGTKEGQTAAGGITLGLVYYILFRHKWMIAAFAIIAIGATVTYYLSYPSTYKSEAKLFVRYVLEAETLSPVGSDPNIRSPDNRGSSIINAEMDILSSFDLAEQVAEKVGPEKILAKADGGKERLAAAGLIRRNMLMESAKNSSVIRVGFSHPDPALASTILAEIISQYLKKHVEIHRSLGMFDEFLTQETDQLRSRLAQTEEEIRKVKERSGIISLDDTKTAYTEQISKVRQDLFNAEAELVQRQAALAAMNQLVGAKPVVAEETNELVVVPVTPAKISEYQLVCSQLENLLKQQLDLLSRFTAENPRVVEVSRRIAEFEQTKETLEKENPLLAASAPVVNGVAAPPLAAPSDEPIRIAALEAKIKVLGAQLEKIRKEAASLDSVESTITELQRKKEGEEVQYRYYSSKLEQSRIDEALGLGKVSNVSTIQAPSPPFKDSGKRNQICAGILAAGLLIGTALAFLKELYLDRSIKRASEIETKLNIPLLLAIPEERTLKISRGLLAAPKALNGNGIAVNGEHKSEADSIAWGPDQHLYPYCEGLRDRVVTYFEVNNLTHNPKLVALTGCAKNAGVTTIAAGLAASLSETGDGNVLLVDMSVNNGAARHFFKGQAECGLDELLDSDNRDLAMVQENLYVVSEGPRGEKMQRVMPKRFNALLPKLKASDYDYIIFDLPPITQTSETARMASFMDMVLLVVESEKTSQDSIKQAMRMLGTSRPKVNAILNKTHNRVPKWLHQEGDLS